MNNKSINRLYAEKCELERKITQIIQEQNARQQKIYTWLETRGISVPDVDGKRFHLNFHDYNGYGEPVFKGTFENGYTLSIWVHIQSAVGYISSGMLLIDPHGKQVSDLVVDDDEVVFDNAKYADFPSILEVIRGMK